MYGMHVSDEVSYSSWKHMLFKYLLVQKVFLIIIRVKRY